MQLQRSGNIRRTSNVGSCTYAGKHTAENQCIVIYGVSERENALMMFDRHANLKYKFGQRSFWCRGYYVDTVGKNAKRIAEYVRNQLKEDMMYDQISIKEYKDPFNG